MAFQSSFPQDGNKNIAFFKYKNSSFSFPIFFLFSLQGSLSYFYLSLLFSPFLSLLSHLNSVMKAVGSLTNLLGLSKILDLSVSYCTPNNESSITKELCAYHYYRRDWQRYPLLSKTLLSLAYNLAKLLPCGLHFFMPDDCLRLKLFGKFQPKWLCLFPVPRLGENMLICSIRKHLVNFSLKSFYTPQFSGAKTQLLCQGRLFCCSVAKSATFRHHACLRKTLRLHMLEIQS